MSGTQNLQGHIGTIQEIYDFFTGGDSRMAAPIAKIFLCLTVILGVATYIMVDKYFAVIEDSRKILLQNVKLDSEVNQLSTKLETATIELQKMEDELDAYKKGAPDRYPEKPTYEEPAAVRPPRQSSINTARLIDLIND